MWQIIVVAAVVIIALAYVVRSLARSAKGEECDCGTGTCSLREHRSQTSLPGQTASPAISAESLEESARNLARRHTDAAR